MPKFRPQVIEGEFVNNLVPVYRMKDGERGVFVIRRGLEGIQKVTLQFTPRGQKTFRYNVPELVTLNMAHLVTRDFPSTFFYVTEVQHVA